MSSGAGTDPAFAYADALARPDPAVSAALTAPGAVFQSPYTRLDTPELIADAFTARARAFSGLAVGSTVSGQGRAAIAWTAAVGDQRVEGVDLLTSDADGRISRVDVFLRPAAVLPAVREAMKAAWPHSGRDPSRG